MAKCVDCDIHFKPRQLLPNGCCYECDSDRLERAVERSRAANQNAEANGLEPLTGSTKQIAWASDIRDKLLTKLKQSVARNDPLAAPLLSGLSQNGNASWWIDNRRFLAEARYFEIWKLLDLAKPEVSTSRPPSKFTYASHG